MHLSTSDHHLHTAKTENPQLALICNHDLGKWCINHALGESAGQLGPYGFEHLAPNFDLQWTDRRLRYPFNSWLINRSYVKVEYLRPDLSGWFAAAVAQRLIRNSDCALAMFEDQALGFAALQSLQPHSKRTPLTAVICWLAEQGPTLTHEQRRRISKRLKTIDALVTFSNNQPPILAECFNLDADRIHFVPFGIDSNFFSPPKSQKRRSMVLSVGRDKSRDLATLLKAAETIDAEVAVVTGPGALDGRELPSNVRPAVDIDHRTYRQLLQEATAVIVPTHAPAYPGGQTVVLEAMATATPCITTDSDAMRDYVVDGVTGFLVPKSNAAAISDKANELLASEASVAAVGHAARLEVEQKFSHQHMWHSMRDIISSTIHSRSE